MITMKRRPEIEEFRSKEHAEWLTTRPESVQRLAAEFPIGCMFYVGNQPDGVVKTLYLFGYTESDSLIVSQYDPNDDYDQADIHREYICAEHLREAEDG